MRGALVRGALVRGALVRGDEGECVTLPASQPACTAAGQPAGHLAPRPPLPFRAPLTRLPPLPPPPRLGPPCSRVDFVATHLYSCNLRVITTYLNQVHTRCDPPPHPHTSAACATPPPLLACAPPPPPPHSHPPTHPSCFPLPPLPARSYGKPVWLTEFACPGKPPQLQRALLAGFQVRQGGGERCGADGAGVRCVRGRWRALSPQGAPSASLPA